MGAEGQPWLYQIMAASRLVCVGTAISPHFVLTTAHCVLARAGPKYLQQVGSQTFISLQSVVIHHQWGLGWDLALIKTKTSLRHFICLPAAPLHNQQLRAVQVGFKLSNLDRQSDNLNLFYQNITLPSQQSGCKGPACSGHPDLHKWVKIFDKNILLLFTFGWSGQVPGSLLETQTRPGSALQLVGIVSGRISDGSECSPTPWLVRLDTEKSLEWIAAVTSENIPVTEVL